MASLQTTYEGVPLYGWVMIGGVAVLAYVVFAQRKAEQDAAAREAFKQALTREAATTGVQAAGGQTWPAGPTLLDYGVSPDGVTATPGSSSGVSAAVSPLEQQALAAAGSVSEPRSEAATARSYTPPTAAPAAQPLPSGGFQTSTPAPAPTQIVTPAPTPRPMVPPPPPSVYQTSTPTGQQTAGGRPPLWPSPAAVLAHPGPVTR